MEQPVLCECKILKIIQKMEYIKTLYCYTTFVSKNTAERQLLKRSMTKHSLKVIYYGKIDHLRFDLWAIIWV